MSTMKNYDVVVIGGGPGGYVAAIRCGQLGLATALVDRWLGADGKPALGGTCLNVGCIPSKTLLHWSERYHEAGHDFANHGIKVGELGLDLKAMMADKTKVVDSFTAGIEFLFKKNKVDYLTGLLSDRDLSTAQSAAVGDTGNDVPMLSAAGVGVFVGADNPDQPGIHHMPDADVRSVAEFILRAQSE